MRILQVVSDTDRRGAQVFATDLAVPLRDRGHTVETVALVPGTTGGLATEALSAGPAPTAALRALRARMAAVDVTVAHGSTTGPACALAGLGRGRPFVYRQISDSRFWAPTRVKRLRVRAALARARFVVALSEFNRAQLVDWIGLSARRIVVVPNGVPGTRFTPASLSARVAARAALGLGLGEAQPIALYVGALVPEKGVDIAIRSLRAVPDVHLVVAGAGPEGARLEQLAAAWAPGRVHFAGSHADAVPLYHAADLLVLPSRGGDAMPAALIEAGLCGLPVVSTRVGAIPEVVLEGTTGFVVPPDDDAVAQAITLLTTSPTDRRRMGEAARVHCLEHYEIDRVADGWEAVLVRATDRA